MKIINRVALLLIASLLFSGCGITLTAQQKSILDKYAASVTNGGAEASTDIRLAYDNTIYANRQILVMTGMSNNVALTQIEGPLKGASLSERLNAAEVLKNYGELLSALASSNDKEKFRKAATQALKGINEFGDAPLIGQDAQDGITTAIMAVGGIFIERKKAQAIRKVILAYHDPVNELCARLLNDLGLEGDENGVAYSVDGACRDLMRESRIILRDKNSSVADRATAMNAETFVYETRSTLNERSEKFVELLAKLRANNDALVKAFKDGIPKDFDLLVDEVNGLADLAKELTD